MKPTKQTIVRSVVLVLAIINNALVLFGKSPLPIDNEAVSFIFTTAAALWAWWKNNSFTKEAIEADVYLRDLRDGYEEEEDIEE